MLNKNKKFSLRSKLLASAATGVVAMHAAMPLAAGPSQVMIDLLDNDFVQLTTAGSVLHTFQIYELGTVTSDFSAIDHVTDLNNSSGGFASGGFASGGFSSGGSFRVVANTLDASAKVNIASNTISSSTTPALVNSSAISNLQVNGAPYALGLAENQRFGVLAQSEASGFSGSISVDNSSVAVDENTLLVSSKGNISKNTIVIDDAVSIDGTTSAGTTKTLNGNGIDEYDIEVNADLVVANAQLNDGNLVSGSGTSIEIDGFELGFGSGALDSGGGITKTLEIAAVSIGTDIFADLEGARGSSVTVSTNTVEVTARGNDAENAIETGESAASIVGSLAIVNQQSNVRTEVIAANTKTSLGININTLGDAIGGSGALDDTLTVDGNAVTSDAYGNNVVQTLSLNANAINGEATAAANIGLSSGSGFSGGSGGMTLTGMATISNIQLSTSNGSGSGSGVIVTAGTTGANVYVTTGDGSGSTEGSSLDLTDNTISASAIGNRAKSSAVSLTGNDVGTGVGVVSTQIGINAAIATTSGSAIVADVTSGSNLIDSTLTVFNNATKAQSILNAAATTITVDANNVVAEANEDPIIYQTSGGFGSLPDITGSFITLNTQSVGGTSDATTWGSKTSIDIGENVSGSTVELNDNTTFAGALGNDGLNAITLEFNDLTVSSGGSPSGASANIATAMTQQTLFGKVVAAADSTTTINVKTDIVASSVSNNGNTIEALATGNRTTANNVSVSATNIDTGEFNKTVELNPSSNAYNASFLAIGTQVASGGILAILGDNSGSTDADIEIKTIVGDDIWGSTVTVDANLLRASATGNSGVNGGALTVDSSSDTTIGVSNYQSVEGTVEAQIGTVGVDGNSYASFTLVGSTVDTKFVADASNLTDSQKAYLAANLAGYSYSSPDDTVSFDNTAREPDFPDFDVTGTSDGNTFTSGDMSALSEDQIAFFKADQAGNGVQYNSATGVFTLTATGSVSRFSLSDTDREFKAGSYGGSDQLGGVLLVVGDNIGQNSTVSVSDNIVDGLVTGNIATNTLVVDANILNDAKGSGNASSNDGNQVISSNSVATSQSVNAGLKSNVAGRFGVVMNSVSGGVDGSTVTVDGNTQLASVIANTVTNTLTVNATTMNATSGVNNAQNVNASLTAMSDLDVFAFGSVSGSSLSLSDNTSKAFVRGNVATTAMSVTGVTLSYDASDIANFSADSDDALGSVVSYNTQDTETSILKATALINVFNTESSGGVSGGSVDGSTVSLSGNRAIADAASVVGTVTLDLDGTNIQSTVALGSEQSHEGDIEATATANVVFSLGDDGSGSSDGGTVVQDSSIYVDENVTTVFATANSFTQTLSITGVNVIGSSNGNGGSDYSGGDASYVVGSYQDVAGGDGEDDIIASATSTNYGVSLFGNGSGVVDSMISVSNNATTAQARGNILSQSISVDANNSDDATYALFASQETEALKITAEATDIKANIKINTASLVIDPSTLSVNGNATNAYATGNLATSNMSFDAVSFNGGVSEADIDALNDVNATASLFNLQDNDAEVVSNVTKVEYGIDLYGADDVALENAFDVSGNSVTAQALGNRAENMVTLNATDMEDSSLGLNSIQVNKGYVFAEVSNVSIGMTAQATLEDASITSTLNVIGNSSIARAMGNSVSNGIALNGVVVKADANLGASVASTSEEDDYSVTATAGLMSFQSNQNAVRATSSIISYGVALNAGDEALDASIATVSGNSIASLAIGNAAYNSVTVSVMDNEASYGLANHQLNTGDVVAEVSGSSIEILSYGGVSRSMTSISNNTITATAIGNSVTNVLGQ